MNYDVQKALNREKISKYKTNDAGSVDFYPAYIQLEQTNKCNARCIMCNHFYTGNKGAEDLSPEIEEKISTILPYCETLMLNGDGEPFLSFNISNRIRRFAQYEVKVGTNTNLCYIPSDCWELFQNSFAFLNISCDGADKDTFELIRQGLDYRTFLQNLYHLNEVAPKLRKNLDCVVMRQNIHQVKEIVKFATDNSFNSVRFHRLGVNPCIGNEDDSDVNFIDYAAKTMVEAFEFAKELHIDMQCPIYPKTDMKSFSKLSIQEHRAIIERRREIAIKKYGHLSLANDYLSEKVSTVEQMNGRWLANKNCQWAIERCYIDIKGNVSMCCFNVKKTFGNLHEMSFDEIWNGENYRFFRKQMSDGYLPSFCKTCNWIKESKF